MKLDFDRMATLAGIPTSSKNKLNESRDMEEAHVTDFMENEEADEGMEGIEGMYEEADEGMYEDDMAYEGDEEADEGMEEMIEIDEVMLVQELRRAKKQLQESKRKTLRKNIQEKKLKRIIEQEVKNIFSDESLTDELNLTAGWVYGKKKPTASRKGYVHQGSFLKGIGFE